MLAAPNGVASVGLDETAAAASRLPAFVIDSCNAFTFESAIMVSGKAVGTRARRSVRLSLLLSPAGDGGAAADRACCLLLLPASVCP